VTTNHTDDNPYWASVENALMHPGFNQYIGSWYYDNKHVGLFHNLVKRQFSTLGYQFWFEDSEHHHYEDEEDRANNAGFEDQCKWFFSERFLKIDWKERSELREYLKLMEDIGFYVKFFNWSCTCLEWDI